MSRFNKVRYIHFGKTYTSATLPNLSYPDFHESLCCLIRGVSHFSINVSLLRLSSSVVLNY